MSKTILLLLLISISSVACKKTTAPPTSTTNPTPTKATQTAHHDKAKSTPPQETFSPPQTRYPDAQRIVAIGDVHGDLSATRRALKIAGVIDDKDSWIAKDLVLVQTGDLVDRGDDEQAIIDLFESLRTQAPKQGGLVVVLNGNHEIMNVQGDLRYITPGGFKDFEDVPNLPLNDPRLAKYPEHARHRVAAFLPGGPYAKMLAAHPTVAIVGQTAFAHGGILPKHVTYGLEKINAETSLWMLGKQDKQPKILRSEESPIWSRHYSSKPDEEDCKLLEETLKALNVKRMVVGHTPQKHGISSACNDKVWRIDVGMAAHYGGNAQALEISTSGVRVLTEESVNNATP